MTVHVTAPLASVVCGAGHEVRSGWLPSVGARSVQGRPAIGARVSGLKAFTVMVSCCPGATVLGVTVTLRRKCPVTVEAVPVTVGVVVLPVEVDVGRVWVAVPAGAVAVACAVDD